MVPPLLQDQLMSSTDNTTRSKPTGQEWSHSQIEHQKLNNVDITQPAAPQMQESVKFSMEKSDMREDRRNYSLIDTKAEELAQQFNGSQISSQYDELNEVKAFLADINSHKKGYESQLQVKYSIYIGLV